MKSCFVGVSVKIWYDTVIKNELKTNIWDALVNFIIQKRVHAKYLQPVHLEAQKYFI